MLRRPTVYCMTSSSSPQFSSLYDVAHTHAELISAVGGGSIFGEVGERVAAAITGTSRVTGTGRDLSGAQVGFERPADPIGLLAPGPDRTPYASYVADLPVRDQNRYQAWRNNPERLGEVKVRQLDRRWDAHNQLMDTRGAGPSASFFPFVDFYVLIIIDLGGDIVMARELSLAEMVDYVASDVGRGGTWNYKAAIHLDMTSGIDHTTAAKQVLRQPLPSTSSKKRRSR